MSPGGQGFKLKLHQTQPDAPLSPVYVDLRVLRSFPKAKKIAAQAFADLVATSRGPAYFDRLADLPMSVTPIVSTLSDILGIGMVTPREAKGHGTNVTVEGVFESGQKVAVFDDLITKGDTKFAALGILKDAGLVVEDIYVLLDREQGGSKMLREQGYNLHASVTLRDLLWLYQNAAVISSAEHGEIMEYLNNNS